MASTTPPSDDNTEQSLEPGQGFEKVRNALDESQDGKIGFWQFQDAYDTIIAIYPDENHAGVPEAEVESSDELLPSREPYEDSDYDSVSAINEYAEGETLVVAFDLDVEDTYGLGVPTHKEMEEEGLSGEGNWWDNPEELEADILLDRNSFYGAVDVHSRPEVFDLRYDGGSAQAYLLEN